MTQKQIIISYLRWLNDWCPAYDLRGKNTPFGFTGHQADRRARELANEGKILHKIEGKYSYYRSKEAPAKEYKVLDALGNPYQTIKLFN